VRVRRRPAAHDTLRLSEPRIRRASYAGVPCACAAGESGPPPRLLRSDPWTRFRGMRQYPPKPPQIRKPAKPLPPQAAARPAVQQLSEVDPAADAHYLLGYLAGALEHCGSTLEADGEFDRGLQARRPRARGGPPGVAHPEVLLDQAAEARMVGDIQRRKAPATARPGCGKGSGRVRVSPPPARLGLPGMVRERCMESVCLSRSGYFRPPGRPR
jgi:hypothetical protein